MYHCGQKPGCRDGMDGTDAIQLLNPLRWVSVGGNTPNCLCTSHCTHPADPLCPLHPSLSLVPAPLCKGRMQPCNSASRGHSRGMKSQQIQTQTDPLRGQAPHGEETCRFGGGNKEHMVCFLLSGDTKISICHTPPGMAATRILAASLHASLNRGHLCAKATFEGDKLKKTFETHWTFCSRPEDISGTLPIANLVGFVSSFPDVQTQTGSLLASEGRSFYFTKHRLT